MSANDDLIGKNEQGLSNNEKTKLFRKFKKDCEFKKYKKSSISFLSNNHKPYGSVKQVARIGPIRTYVHVKIGDVIYGISLTSIKICMLLRALENTTPRSKYTNGISQYELATEYGYTCNIDSIVDEIISRGKQYKPKNPIKSNIKLKKSPHNNVDNRSNKSNRDNKNNRRGRKNNRGGRKNNRRGRKN